MKKIFTIIFTVITVQLSFAQRFDWATSGGYVGTANSFLGAIDIAQDPQGNIYTMDTGNRDQQCQGDTISPFGGTTAFIYKFNAQGELLFINRVGPVVGDFTPFNIETDEDGNLYVLGQQNSGNLIVNEDTIAAIANTSQLVKIDSDGNFVWIRNTGFASNGEGCMLQYADGNIYFQSGNLTVSKMNVSGSVVGTLAASYYSSPTASQSVIFKGSGIFSNNDLLFAAYSRGEVAFGTDTLFNTGNPFLTAPVLLVRCDTSLNLDWARYLSNARDPDQNFIPIAIDGNDNVYTAVQVNDELIIGTDTIDNTNNAFIGEGAIVKVNSTGNDVWAKALQSTNTALAWCMQRANDNSGIIIGGGYTGSATFGPFTLTNGSTSLPFIAKMDFDGNFTNAFNFLQAPGSTDASCLLADGSGNYTVGGKLSSITAPVFSCTPIAGARGFYLGSFSEQPDNVPTPTITANGSLLTATPMFSGDIQWYLDGDALDGQNGQTLNALESGNYTVEYAYTTGCVGSETSAIESITITSVGINTDNYNLVVYPNPSNGVFQISGKKDEMPTRVSIRNLAGAIIYESFNYQENQPIEINQVPTGIYFFEVLTDKEAISFKVLKK